MSARHIVRAPFHVKEAVGVQELIAGVGFVFRIDPPVPTGPYGGRIHINDVLAEFTATDSRYPVGVPFMCKIMQLLHKRADGFLVEIVKVSLPVVFVADPPNDD
ncbi:hypothetical protein D3C73_1505030 [compost metagenome]